jgi:hypothetical protein
MYIVKCTGYNNGGRCAKHNAARAGYNNKNVFRKTGQKQPRPVYNRHSEKCRAYRNRYLIWNYPRLVYLLNISFYLPPIGKAPYAPGLYFSLNF